MMTVFHASLWQSPLGRNHNGSFGRAAGKSIEILQRPAVHVKSINRDPAETI